MLPGKPGLCDWPSLPSLKLPVQLGPVKRGGQGRIHKEALRSAVPLPEAGKRLGTGEKGKLVVPLKGLGSQGLTHASVNSGAS